jgi:hypothetical protein
MSSKSVLLPARIPVLACAILTCVTGCVQMMRMAKPSNPSQPIALLVAPQVSVRYSGNWTESVLKFANAHELVRLPKLQTATPGAPAATSQVRLARMLITTEPRLSRSDARQRLLDIARSRSTSPSFFSIGGWPAVEIRFKEPLPEPGDEDAEGRVGPPPIVQRAMMAIAANQQVVDFDIWLAPDAPSGLLDEAVGIAQSATFPDQENPDDLRRILDGLKQSAQQSDRPTGSPGSPPKSTARAFFSPSPLPTVLQPNSGQGELEITSSDDAGALSSPATLLSTSRRMAA